MPAISPRGYDRLKAGVLDGSEKARRIGKYLVRREIGRGGMAVVYEAEDPELHRRVALKIIREAGLVERLHREAEIAAQLQHPNIVAVHEVGSAADAGLPVHYIAMEYIEGRTFAQVLAERTTPRAELLRMLEDVARAAGFAHAKSVVHRDVKPGNVLVDASGRVLLADFGLARSTWMDGSLTKSGDILGTPHYMAPEQVRGDTKEAGAAADVWALGVMLFEIATGGVPFHDLNAIQIYRRILEDDPLHPPMVERDLEAVWLKALSKDAAGRYATGKEFADDLARFRRGEPVIARAPSIVDRIGRRLKRRKALLSAAAAMLVVVAVLAGVIVSARGDALDQLRQRTDVALGAALEFRRAGKLDAMQRFANETRRACEETAARHPELAEPHYRLGRMYRALMRDEEAFAEQEKALALEPRHALALYERVVLTCGRLRRRSEELRAAAFVATSTDTTIVALRTRIEEDVQLIAALLTGPEVDCARGMAAWAGGDTARARALLEASRAKSNDLEEVFQGLAMLALDEHRFGDAVNQWSEGIEHDRGYFPHLDGRGFARLAWGLDQANRGTDPSASFSMAVDDLGEALKLAGPRGHVLVRRGVTYFLWGFHFAGRGGDPRPRYGLALADFNAALALDARDDRALMWRGITQVSATFHRLEHGEESTAGLDAALDDLSQALQFNPAAAESWMWRGVIEAGWAFYDIVRGADAKPRYDVAIADLEEAVRRSPDEGDPRMWRGFARATWALGLTMRGKEAKPEYDAALRDLDDAVRLLPERVEVRCKRGATRLGLASYQSSRGGDPRPAIDEAMRDYDEALKRNGKCVDALAGRARAHLIRGQWLSTHGQDPVGDWRQGLDAIGVALAINADAPGNWQLAGLLHEAAGLRPTVKEELEAALKAFAQAVKINPTLEGALRERIARIRRAQEGQ